ncbi:protein FAM32A-like [Artemia franciscana]|uniref:protein FAM32A-like n=1 Tax=Artemia franciscana TaxID=6661 RepID=UPI0024CB1138|nr:EOG090X0P1V [Artemia franciscana]
MDFDYVVKGGLKLKKPPSAPKQKKKKKQEKDGNEEVPKVNSSIEKSSSVTVAERKVLKTRAELAFQETKNKMLEKKIKEKALKTHKQKVEEFNRHLDSLTEHFDIQKVSWTK